MDEQEIYVYKHDAGQDPERKKMAAFFTAAIEVERWQRRRAFWGVGVVLVSVICLLLVLQGRALAIVPWALGCLCYARAVLGERHWRQRLGRFEAERLDGESELS
jgi:hypothetical protein